MLKITAVFLISVVLGGEEVTRIGPFPDSAGCFDLRKEVQADIDKGFKTTSVYGISGDMWGVGGGAIFRVSDYDLDCVRIETNTETGEIISEMRFN